jgi:hypothetical protein
MLTCTERLTAHCISTSLHSIACNSLHHVYMPLPSPCYVMYRQCCGAGQYVDTDARTTHQCALCNKETMICDQGGATVQTLALRAGYWRDSLESSDIRPCFNEEACIGGGGKTDVDASAASATASLTAARASDTLDAYCAEGYTGPCEFSPVSHVLHLDAACILITQVIRQVLVLSYTMVASVAYDMALVMAAMCDTSQCVHDIACAYLISILSLLFISHISVCSVCAHKYSQLGRNTCISCTEGSTAVAVAVVRVLVMLALIIGCIAAVYVHHSKRQKDSVPPDSVHHLMQRKAYVGSSLQGSIRSVSKLSLAVFVKMRIPVIVYQVCRFMSANVTLTWMVANGLLRLMTCTLRY